MAFFSSLIGAVVGYLVYLRQEKIALEKSKLDMANKWLLMAYQIFQQLIGFKENYHKVIDSNPVQRVLSVPTILRNEKNYNFDYYELAFTAIGNNSDKYNLGKLSLIFDNYINLMAILKKRDELNDMFKHELLSKLNNTFQISEEEIFKNIDQVQFSILVDLTELFLRNNDDLINELYRFLEIFPQEARKKLN